MGRLLFISTLAFCCSVSAQGIVIDHNCTDLDEIPEMWIISVQDNVQSHYAHTSHGGQLTYGIGFVEDADPFYDCEIGSTYLPAVPGAYCVFDGQESVTYITPDLYWETEGGLDLTRAVLDNNPSLDTSMWSWCTQCDYYDESQVQAYLDAMTLLESEYPGVTFIYFTGNAQGTGSSGYNRYQRNNQIRNYCAANDKVLFDFADIDSWWYNPSSSQWEHETYSYGGTDVPAEHPHYYGDEYGHTTAESCYNKGVAWWWMMAVLAGWGSSGTASPQGSPGVVPEIAICNPSSSPVHITVSLPEAGPLNVSVYEASGRMAVEVFSGYCDAGANDFTIQDLHRGLYLVAVRSGETFTSRRMVVTER